MRHRRKGRQLGRSSSHRKAMLKNLATSLFLTLRDDMYYEGLYQADGTTQVKPPKHKGRVTTTLHKAKEVRPLVEKCVTLAKKALPHIEAADALNTDADRGSEAWKTWREGDGWQKWNAAIAPAINYRRRAYALLGDKEAVSILFDDVAPQFADRPGGYTRVLKLAGVRLGDAGAQAVIEFVGENDRVKQAAKAVKPAFADDETKEEEKAEEAEAEVKEEAKAEEAEAKEDSAAPAAAAAAAGAAATAAATEDEAEIKSPSGKGFDDLKVVEGIGPKCEEALKAAGIGTWKDLADSTPDKIKEILAEADGNFAGQVPTTWPDQAKMAVDGDWEKLEKWQDELDGGKLPE